MVPYTSFHTRSIPSCIGDYRTAAMVGMCKSHKYVSRPEYKAGNRNQAHNFNTQPIDRERLQQTARLVTKLKRIRIPRQRRTRSVEESYPDLPERVAGF